MKRIFIISVLFVFAMCIVSNQSFAAGAWTGNVNIFYGLKTLDPDDWSATGDDLILDQTTIDNETYIITMRDIIGDDIKLAVDKGTEFGINIDFGPKSWPVCIAIGFYKSKSEDSSSGTEVYTVTDYYDPTITYDITYKGRAKLKVSTQELRLGVKKIFEVTPTISPYVAGGLAKISGDADIPYSISIDDPYFGVYDYQLLSSHHNFSDSAIGYWFSGGAYWTFAEQYNLGIELSYSKANIDFGNDIEAEAGGLHYGLFVGFHW